MIIKSLSGCIHYSCTFHIANDLMRYVKRETGVSVSNDGVALINSLTAEIAKSADITEVVQKTRTIMDIFRKALTIGNTKKYRSIEDASLYVGAEVSGTSWRNRTKNTG